MRRGLSDLVLAGVDYSEGVGGMDPFGVGALNAQSLRTMQLPVARANVIEQGMASARTAAVQNAAIAESMPAVILPVDTGAVLVLAGAAFIVNVVPVSRVRITRFTVSPATAGSFVINAILAGRVNLFVGAGGVPADIFAPNNFGPPIEVPLVEAGTILTVGGANIAGAAARLFGAFAAIDLTLKLQGQ
jgi:hypothetical protein